MKKKIFVILAAILLVGTTMVVSAEDMIKSQGSIIFDNGTGTSDDDVIFNAGDLTVLNSRIDQLATDVTTGKGKIAASIKTKDSTSTVSNASSYDILKDGIDKIGIKGTAIASDVVSGKTFFNGAGYTTGNLTLTGNTQAAYVLSGTTFYTNSLTKQTGTMINKSGSASATNVTVNGNTGTVPIPANGYYDTSSKLTIDLTTNNNSYYEKGYSDGAKNAVPAVITSSNTTLYRYEGQSYDVVEQGSKKQWKDYYDLIFDIKSTYANYASLTADNFNFCITGSKIEHYISSGCNIHDPKPFTMEKVYDPSTGQLTIKNVCGGSYETGNDPGRIAFTITGFKLLIL